jgi:hypothetical protein
MPSTFPNGDSSRSLLPFDQLPRGLVKFPPHIVEGVARERTQFPPEVYTEAYARESLERHTLIHYYEGIPVAYRPAADGIEVLALGFAEVARYSPSPQDGVKVVQS